MKLLTKDILIEHGFSHNELKSDFLVEVMSKEEFDVVIKDHGTVYYSNLGIDYPLKDLATLRKVFKEVKRKNL